MTVNCQQGGPPSQKDDMKIPAKAAIQFLAVRQCFDTKMPLERDGQAQTIWLIPRIILLRRFFTILLQRLLLRGQLLKTIQLCSTARTPPLFEKRIKSNSHFQTLFINFRFPVGAGYNMVKSCNFVDFITQQIVVSFDVSFKRQTLSIRTKEHHNFLEMHKGVAMVTILRVVQKTQ